MYNNNIYYINEFNIPTFPRTNGIYIYNKISKINFSYNSDIIKIYNKFINANKFGIQLIYKTNITLHNVQ